MNNTLKQIQSRAQRIILSLPFMMTVGFIVSYLLFSYFAVNPIAQRLLPWVGENKLASQLTAERVSFDPLRLALTVDQLSLATPEGTSLAGFERLHADLEVSGIMRWSWRLKEVQLSKPHLTFESRKGGGSNWSGLIAKLNETPDENPNKGMARVLIDHLLIARGDIEYIDKNRAEVFRAVLEPLDLELDGFSTLPEDLGDYAILAKLPEQGGILKWKGELGLNPLFSNGKVELEGLRLAKLLKVLPPEALPVRVNEGSLKTSLDYEFALKNDQPQVKVSKLAMVLEGLAATLLQSRDQAGSLKLQQVQLSVPTLEYTGTQPAQLRVQDLKLELQELGLSQAGVALLQLPSLQLDGLNLDLQQQQVDIASVRLTQGQLHAMRDAQGEVNWQLLQQATQGKAAASSVAAAEKKPENQPAPQEPTGAEPAPAAKDSGFDVVLHELALQDFALDFEDRSFKQGLKLAAQDFQLNLKLAAQGGQVQVSEINSSLGPLQLRSGQEKKPTAILNKIEIKDGQLDLAQRKLDLDAIILQGLQSDIIRNANGINWQAMLQAAAPAQAEAVQATDGATKAAQASEAAWSLELKRLALQNAALHIEDQTTPETVKLDVENLGLELGKLSLDTKRALPLKLAFKVKQGGSFNLDGKLTPATLNADLKLKLSELALLPFAPYVNQAALLKLNAGQVNTAGQLNLKQGSAFEYKGGFSVDKLDITEEEGGQPFLGWHSLLSNSLTVANQGLHMAELQIHQPKGKFIIYEDRSLNIKRILRESPQAQAQAQAGAQAVAQAKPVAKPQPGKSKASASSNRTSPAAPSSQQASAQAKPPAQADFAVAVERIRVDEAQLEFADLSLRPQFGTYIHSLSGVINGLSSEARSTAQVELDGKVDEFGSARIRGALQPFQATEYTDLKLVFRNLEMNRLTPYSGKFAGRRIDAGKLSVDLEYKIKQRKLAGENKFIINKLKLGDKVDSEDAVNLPLDLAIALLEDSNGVIDLDLPVSGSLDDPEFSYGKVVWKALVNVLGKIVTSPFRALGNLLGLGADKLEALVFDTGSAKLAPPEQEKLKALSSALTKRPNLTLSIAPVIDEKRDARALQEQYVRNQVIAKTGVKLAPGEQAGPVDLGNSRIRLALSKIVREQLSHEKVAALRKEAKEYAKGKEEQEAQQYEYAQILEALVQDTKVDPAWLPTLSKARAQAVQQYLQVEQGLPAARIKLVETKQVSASGSEVSMPLELGVAKH